MTSAASKHEPRIDSRVLASALQLRHHSILALAKKYQSQLEGFGPLPAEEESTGALGRPVRFKLLNEAQVFFILLLVRPTKHSIDLKAKFIEAFAAARAAGGGFNPNFGRLAGGPA